MTLPLAARFANPRAMRVGYPQVAGCSRGLLVAVDDPAALEIVGRELDLHPVAGQDADVVAAHLAGDVREHLELVVEADPEHGVRQGLRDLALHLDLLFLLAHEPPSTGDAIHAAQPIRGRAACSLRLSRAGRRPA